MKLDQAVKNGWRYANRVNSRISAFPKFLVEGVIAKYDIINKRVKCTIQVIFR